jgi:hypothetical protein
VYAELEIFLYRRGEAEYAAVFRLRPPDNATDQRFEAEPVRIDRKQFEDALLLDDPPRYGLALGSALFGHPKAREAFVAARAAAGTRGDTPLRVRLCTDQRSLDLHRLRWETLRFPDRDYPDDSEKADWLAVNQRVLFSRHLFSADMRPVRLRPKSDLTALIAVANPTDITKYWSWSGRKPLAPIQVEDELATAEHGLRSLRIERLVPDNTPGGQRVTLQRLLEALRQEPDVLYLVCHGASDNSETRLLLEKDDGTAHLVSGQQLVHEFRTVRNLPRLVVLISCQTAGDSAAPPPRTDTAILSALGPKLAEAGVPAVLAMQGDLSMATARDFLPPFFQSLQQSGQVDEAVTHGRAAVRTAWDGWVPVLYTRLVEGRVWFTRG